MVKRCPACLSTSYHSTFDDGQRHACDNGHEFDSPISLNGLVYSHIRQNPGITGRELSNAFDIDIQLQTELKELVDSGKLTRTDDSPYRYHPSRYASKSGGSE